MKTILLSRALGYTIKEATRLAALLGHRNVKFITARTSTRQGPRIAQAGPINRRYARFVQRDCRHTQEDPGVATV